MPKALPLNCYDADEIASVRSFVAKHLPAVLSAPIEAIEGRKALLNKETGETIIVVPVSKVEGMLRVVLEMSTLQPFETDLPCHQVALFDVDTSECHLIQWERFAGLCQNPNVAGGMVRMNAVDQTWGMVWIQPEWARINLDKMAVFMGSGHSRFSDVRNAKKSIKENFVHLHNHSAYSLLDGASTIEGMVYRARANGQPGLALTDHGYCFGSYKFYRECKSQGIKPILGCEIYLVDDASKRYQDSSGGDRRFEYHQTILCQNNTGWQNLSKLLSKACRDNFYYVPRVDHKSLFEHSEGLIVLSGCFKGPVAWHLQDHSYMDPLTNTMVNPAAEKPWMTRNPDHSRAIMRQYKSVFGDRYYIELQNIDYQRYMNIMPEIAQMAVDEGIPAVATNDCHYELAEDAAMQALMTRISTSKVDDIGNDLSKVKGVYFLRDRAEMECPTFTPDMLDRTCEIMDRCDLDLDFKGYLFPEYNMTQDKDWAAYQAKVPA